MIGASSTWQSRCFISLGGGNHANLLEAQKGLMPQISLAFSTCRNR